MVKQEQTTDQISFQIILHAGNAKSNAYSALEYAREGNYQESDNMLEKAKEEINLAHNFQTNLLTLEASGSKQDISIILVHSQDHLMTTISEISLIEELIKQIKEFNDLKQIINEKMK